MSTIGTVWIREKEYNIVRGNYPAGNAIYILLKDAQSGANYAVFSVNLLSGAELDEDEFCVKTWSENADLVEPMMSTGLFVDTGRTKPTGYVIAPIWKIKVL